MSCSFICAFYMYTDPICKLSVYIDLICVSACRTAATNQSIKQGKRKLMILKYRKSIPFNVAQKTKKQKKSFYHFILISNFTSILCPHVPRRLVDILVNFLSYFSVLHQNFQVWCSFSPSLSFVFLLVSSCFISNIFFSLFFFLSVFLFS